MSNDSTPISEGKVDARESDGPFVVPNIDSLKEWDESVGTVFRNCPLMFH